MEGQNPQLLELMRCVYLSGPELGAVIRCGYLAAIIRGTHWENLRRLEDKSLPTRGAHRRDKSPVLHGSRRERRRYVHRHAANREHQ